MIRIILWDVDGTLLNFAEAEKHALNECFRLFELGICSDAMLGAYSGINKTYWQRLERGEIDKREVLVGRFQTFFAQEGIPCPDLDALNVAYQKLLGASVYFNDNAYELLSSLRGRVKQYAVTNGTVTAQTLKLEKSGLVRLFDGVFISDLIGAEKPTMAFFDHVFSHIEPCDKDEIMIVGDSLTSDMRGGNNAGVRCCWYNPAGEPLPAELRIDHDIRNLNEVRDIIDR